MAFSEVLKRSDGSDTKIIAVGSTRRSRDLSQSPRVSLVAANGAGASVTFTVEGSLDGVNYGPAAAAPAGDATYASAAVTVTAGAAKTLHLHPDLFVRYLRVAVSTANPAGTRFTVYGD